jgi:hypothetical protein
MFSKLLCDWILSCVLTVQPVTPLPDLYYGTVLYDYYQDDYQQALLDALIVEQRGAVGNDPVRLQLAKGSFAFADGMFAMAEQTFASVGDGELTPLDKMRLSFHSARRFPAPGLGRRERNLVDIDSARAGSATSAPIRKWSSCARKSTQRVICRCAECDRAHRSEAGVSRVRCSTSVSRNARGSAGAG